MATGSAATKKQRLVEAGYRTGVSQVNGGPRCDRCRQMQAHPGLFGKTKHDRWCKQLAAQVKTHGGCQHFEKGAHAP